MLLVGHRRLRLLFSPLLLGCVVMGALTHCTQSTRYATPLLPIHYQIYFASSEGRALLPVGGYLRIRQPNVAQSAIGFGGILVLHGFSTQGGMDNYYAYDLACPHELDPKVSLFVNERLEAECPKCHSRYEIMYGMGAPIAGPTQSPLLPYRVIPMQGGLLITAPNL